MDKQQKLLLIGGAVVLAAYANRMAKAGGGATLVWHNPNGGRAVTADDAAADVPAPGEGVFAALGALLGSQDVERIERVGQGSLDLLDIIDLNPFGQGQSPFTAPDFSTIDLTETYGLGSALAPHGIRNGNPGNIEAGDPWKGATGSDGRFVTFSNPIYGLRAMARVLGNYRDQHGLQTVEQMIGRWAPPSENNTGAYVASVERLSGVHRSGTVTAANLPEVMSAMIQVENGRQPYPRELIAAGAAESGKWS